MIELWKERPYVGGKSAVGYGELKIEYPTLTLTSESYLAYLAENKKAVCKTLEHLEKP